MANLSVNDRVICDDLPEGMAKKLSRAKLNFWEAEEHVVPQAHMTPLETGVPWAAAHEYVLTLSFKVDWVNEPAEGPKPQKEMLLPSELRTRMERAERQTPTGSKWAHHKGGKYIVLGVALSSDDLSAVVIYEKIEDTPSATKIIFTRPQKEFMDGRFKKQVEVHDAIRARDQRNSMYALRNLNRSLAKESKSQLGPVTVAIGVLTFGAVVALVAKLASLTGVLK